VGDALTDLYVMTAPGSSYARSAGLWTATCSRTMLRVTVVERFYARSGGLWMATLGKKNGRTGLRLWRSLRGPRFWGAVYRVTES
jgi:hypothetical protein